MLGNFILNKIGDLLNIIINKESCREKYYWVILILEILLDVFSFVNRFFFKEFFNY